MLGRRREGREGCRSPDPVVASASRNNGSSTVGLHQKVKVVFVLAFILYLERLTIFAVIEQIEPGLRFLNVCS